MRFVGLERHASNERKRLLTYECTCGEYLVVEATTLWPPP